MPEIGIGLIGTGFMGTCHAQAFVAARHTFEPTLRPRLEMVADLAADAASAAARRFGFARSTGEWQALVRDPKVEIVSITSPNALHKEMALAALAAGKHVWCEKPLALTGAEARELADAAKASGVTTLVGYNYLRSPAIEYAKRLIDQGELGEVTTVRAVFDEDYMADPALPFSWRCQRASAGTGVLGDMASHAISLMRLLVGPIVEVTATSRTVIDKRPMPLEGAGREERAAHVAVDWNRMAEVENEDLFEAILRFRGGAIGHLGASRIAWGRKNGMDLDLYGTKGAIRFTQERFNEIQVYRPALREDDNGFRTIHTGPSHPPYDRFSPAVGHGLGFNDLKVAEAAHLLDAIAGDTRAYPDFAEGLAIEAVCDALVDSAERRVWVKVA